MLKRVSDNLITRTNRGQTLVIALMVMFLLGTVAAVFVAMVARNLIRSERFSNVDSVSQIAEAGIRYADKMLTSSEEGADWRPKPENEGVEKDVYDMPVFVGGVPKQATSWMTQRDSNPDFKWTRMYWQDELGYCGPTGGFTMYDFGTLSNTANKAGGGRFLLRITYNPDPDNQLSKFIRIESIGRWGVFDNNDPTTYKGFGDALMRREMTAYKPIGVTDYLRFITNKDNRSMDFPLGWQSGVMRFGRSKEESDFGQRGSPIRVNGNLVWNGSVKLYMRGVDADTPIDGVEVSGDIKRADSTNIIELLRMKTDGTMLDAIGSPIGLKDSDASDYVTVGGFYRDGSSYGDASVDIAGKSTPRPRGIKRIDPPLIDQPDTTGTTTRYRLLSLNSGERVNIAASGKPKWFNLGQFGWGRGVYISNTSDAQDESESIVGGYTLISDWLKPYNNAARSPSWMGPYYIPPAAVITLHPVDTDGDNLPDITITRTDVSTNGRKWVWYDAWGSPRPEWGQTITMPYPDPTNGRTIYFRGANGAYDMSKSRQLAGNGVIYAEGNIRIRGMLPKNMQLTVVSNKTIYIDGNLIKYRNPGETVSDTDPWRGTTDTGTCGLALLAHDNICVNTTVFFSPQNSVSADNVGSDANDDTPPYHVIVGNDPQSRLRCEFECGPWESESTTQNSYVWKMFLRHAGQYGPSYINAWLNPNSSAVDWGILKLNNKTPDLPNYVWGVGDSRYNAPGWGVGSMFACDTFSLITGLDPGQLSIIPGMRNLLQIGLDQTSYTRSDYLMGGFAIQPMDIRIEAAMYAQEGSFFVLPGQWFNPNPKDRSGSDRPDGVQASFPFYGQPLDIRIIIDGAISENIPAPMGAVEDWMSKWGVIPDIYGSSGMSTAHPGEGLTILYDDHCGWPYSNLRSAGTDPLIPIRTDKYGRMLPFAPKLPVCESLIYMGDAM